jgi:hypothetical protein
MARTFKQVLILKTPLEGFAENLQRIVDQGDLILSQTSPVLQYQQNPCIVGGFKDPFMGIVPLVCLLYTSDAADE